MRSGEFAGWADGSPPQGEAAMSRAERVRHGAGTVTLSGAEFAALSHFLYARSGLVFGEGKKFLLETRLRRRMERCGVRSPGAYLSLLMSPQRGADELVALLDVVTTHETFFFRNKPQLEAFRSQVLSEMLAAEASRGRRALRIWSAGCSSGEEPYSLAMLVMEELGEALGRWRVEIVGTDIATNMIHKAREGIYHRYSFRGVPAYFLQKYFEPAGPELFRLAAGPRELVEFHVLNFMDQDRMRRMREFNVVFCRNALIYFDKDAKRDFVAHFARALKPGGYLFVGHSESLHGISEDFELVHFQGALGYRKPERGLRGSAQAWVRTT